MLDTMLGMKKQVVLPIKAEYAKDVELFRQTKALHALGIPAALRITANLSDITMPTMPIESLRDLITHGLTSGTRPLMGLSPLTLQVESLGNIITERRALFEELRQQPSLPLFLYFGLPNADGPTDRRYQDTIDQLDEYTDGILYFLERLAVLLEQHGSRLQRKFWRSPPSVVHLDLNDRDIIPYRPDASRFASWERLSRLRRRQDAIAAYEKGPKHLLRLVRKAFRRFTLRFRP